MRECLGRWRDDFHDFMPRSWLDVDPDGGGFAYVSKLHRHRKWRTGSKIRAQLGASSWNFSGSEIARCKPCNVSVLAILNRRQ